MSVFADAQHAASWAGLCPGNRESGGKQLSQRTPIPSEPLQTPEASIAGSLGMELVKVGAAEFVIGVSISEDMVGDNQNLVGRGHNGLPSTSTGFGFERNCVARRYFPRRADSAAPDMSDPMLCVKHIITHRPKNIVPRYCSAAAAPVIDFDPIDTLIL
jgi:hypothetical protein